VQIFAYGPDDVTATPSSLVPENPEWFTFLVPVYPGCPGKKPKAVKRRSSSSNNNNIIIIKHMPMFMLLSS